jgi:hypothetical protein
MKLRIMVTKTQREFVANPANCVYLSFICPNRRHGQPQSASSNYRWTSAKHHVQLIIASDGSNGRCGSAFKRL